MFVSYNFVIDSKEFYDSILQLLHEKMLTLGNYYVLEKYEWNRKM